MDGYNKDEFIKIFTISLLAVLVSFLIAGSIVWYNRGAIFDRFGREYLAAEKLKSENGGEQNFFSQESFVVDAVKKTNPAVVSIVIIKEVPKYEVYQEPTNPFDNLFPNFPGFNFSVPQYRQKGTEEKEVGGGSGFFVTADGLIVTNRHVVEEKDATYTVFTNDGKKNNAKVVAKDPVLDIALIKIEPPAGGGYSFLSLGDSDQLEIGQSVIAIGNALGEFRNTVSVGVISGLARSITAGDALGNREFLDQVIQTDAAINPGNSGGPLLDLSGQVIGVNVAVAQGSQSIGFALPINSIKGAIESVKTTGKIVRPYLGVRYITITEEVKDANKLWVDHGVLVKAGATAKDLAVIPGSPADKAGLVENDIILEVDGKKLDSQTSLASIIRQKSVGQVVTLKILHRGEEKIVLVTLEAAKD